MQVGKLKNDLQGKIDSLTDENRQYRDLLDASAAEIRGLLARLPQAAANENEAES